MPIPRDSHVVPLPVVADEHVSRSVPSSDVDGTGGAVADVVCEPSGSLDGRVVAVINSRGGDNIAFGTSAALTRCVVPQLVETGTYRHAYLGVSLSNVTPEVARANGLNELRGCSLFRSSVVAPPTASCDPAPT